MVAAIHLVAIIYMARLPEVLHAMGLNIADLDMHGLYCDEHAFPISPFHNL